MARSPAPTAGLVLTRGAGESLEVFWARRPDDAPFLAGFYSYFVGRVEPDDQRLPLDIEPGDASAASDDAARRGCALREAFEEGGLLATDRGVWTADTAAGFPLALGFDDYRLELREQMAAFGHDLEAAGLALAASRLRPLGGWTTPRWLEPAFHTEFFELHLTPDEARQPGLDALAEAVEPEEIACAEWVRPADALERWRRREALVTDPIRLVLEHLAARAAGQAPAPIDAGERDADGPLEILGGVRLLALRTPTLPPATHTNAYVLGDDDLLVVDPGPADAGALAPLVDALERLVAPARAREAGRRLQAVVLTHHHPDHIGGAAALCERFDVPVWAHPETARRLPADLAERVDRTLGDGEAVVAGDVAWRCLHTPGHAPGHLCLWEPGGRVLIAGDLVASQGTIVVNPPEGHMGRYLDSLRRVRALEAAVLLPAHGQPVAATARLLVYYVDHRLAREDQVRRALGDHDGPATPVELVPAVYQDVPRQAWPLAARSLEAHLIHLVELGEAVRDGDAFASA